MCSVVVLDLCSVLCRHELKPKVFRSHLTNSVACFWKQLLEHWMPLLVYIQAIMKSFAEIPREYIAGHLLDCLPTIFPPPSFSDPSFSYSLHHSLIYKPLETNTLFKRNSLTECVCDCFFVSIVHSIELQVKCKFKK